MSSAIFIDIETVSGVEHYTDLSPALQHLRDKKCAHRQPDETHSTAALFEQKAGIYAEFGKIVCIVCGQKNSLGSLELMSFAGDDEKKLLSDFFHYLDQHVSDRLCGHNIKEFDLPYICRRAKIHGLSLPSLLLISGKKPREIQHIDTMEMRKFGDYKAYTSLALLCELFGIETPKDDIDGSQVSTVYRRDHDLDRIVTYCKKDVIATAKVYERLL